MEVQEAQGGQGQPDHPKRVRDIADCSQLNGKQVKARESVARGDQTTPDIWSRTTKQGSAKMAETNSMPKAMLI